MAINTIVLNVLRQIRPHLPAEPKICCLGYPDVLVSTEQAQQYLGAEAAARLAYRPDSASIIAWHALQAHLDRCLLYTSPTTSRTRRPPATSELKPASRL